MMGHNIRFEVEIWKIIPKLFLSPLLSGALCIDLPKKNNFVCKTTAAFVY